MSVIPTTASLRQIRLTAFKSFWDTVLPIDPVTVLTGRNNAGKSNALDAIEVLSRLASGESIADALDGRRREGGPIRGGSRGCAPHGESTFSLGCTVDSAGRIFELDVTVEVEPEPRVVKEILRAGSVASALRGVFHLDPIPHLMRDYVPAQDSDLRRTAENISATIAHLMRRGGPEFDRLQALVRAVADEFVEGVTVIGSEPNDVMLALQENPGRRTGLTPARGMSDGLLRFVAVATALLTARRGLDVNRGPAEDGPPPGMLLVIEELENGLHPSQVGRVLQLIREVGDDLATRVMVTTHSPALLNAMTGQLNNSVIVCYRDGVTGHSQLTRLPELPGYAEAMAAGRLGDVMSAGKLAGPEAPGSDFDKFNRLLGIE